MRIFVTGASGWIGSAVVAELLAAGHEVVGLARSDSAAESVAAAGAEVRRGDLSDLELLRVTAAESDGVVHLAFRHDVAFSGDFDTAVASDRAAIDALGEVLAGTDRPLAVASGLPFKAGRAFHRARHARAVPRARAAGSSMSARCWPSPSGESAR